MGHQVLAINRGEREDILKVSVDMDEEEALVAVRRQVVRPGTPAMAFVKAAAEDAYRRLVAPSLEREVRSDLTEKASEGAIGQFALNLKPLLMQPPVKGHVTMGLDPGYRMGCKVAVIDPTGKVLDTTVVYPTHGERGKQEAIAKLSALVKKHHVQHIAIGNGTASRETEQMAVEMIGKLNCGVTYMMVNEAGASVYSASKLAAEEFPDFDVNLRSAVSIARRLQDPLAELVKIDPKSIGVGQYQHDMPQARLGEALDGVVEDCVNAVGVDVNTASAPLLARVAGLTQTTAKNMVKYREENGPFTTRKQILKVPKLGPKAFEQCAGFLRVPESNSPLDNTAVHPESYAAAQKLLELCGYTMEQVKAGTLQNLMDKVKAYGVEQADGSQNQRFFLGMAGDRLYFQNTHLLRENSGVEVLDMQVESCAVDGTDWQPECTLAAGNAAPVPLWEGPTLRWLIDNTTSPIKIYDLTDRAWHTIGLSGWPERLTGDGKVYLMQEQWGSDGSYKVVYGLADQDDYLAGSTDWTPVIPCTGTS